MENGPPRTVRLDEIARAVQAQVAGKGDTVLAGASSLEEAGPDQLSYVEHDRFAPMALASKAAAFVVGREIPQLNRPQLIAPNPKYTFACIVQQFFVPASRPRGVAEPITRGGNVQIGPDPSIWPFVTLGNDVTIGARVTLYPGVFVGDGVGIGDDCVLYPNVTVREGCQIGARVIVHSGTVIGSDGFGYAQHQGRHHKIPQLGIVVIEDDVELGANVTVDRATFGRTVIKRGTKVDNLVQIAHNVTVGEDSILVAQVGIAGSTVLGHHVMVGGQAGLTDHITVGDGVMIAARSGVNRSIASGQIVSGAPVMPHQVAVKAQAVVPLLPELRRQLRDLEKRVRTLEGRHQKAGGRERKAGGRKR
jgi:UDP-3-O-[3-hydroxymyristoyl] glucosamine N-acyltransferase